MLSITKVSSPPSFGGTRRRGRRPLDEAERRTLCSLVDLALLAGLSLALRLPALAVAAMVLVLIGCGLYRRRNWRLRSCLELAACALVLGLAGWCLAVISGLITSPAWQSALAAVCVPVAAPIAWRLIFFRRFAHMTRRRAAIVGADEEAVRLAVELLNHPDAGYVLVGQILAPDAPVSGRVPVLGTIDRLPELATAYELDMIVVTRLQTTYGEALLACIERGVSVLSLTTVCERFARRLPVRQLDHAWLLRELGEGERLIYAWSKRGVDVVAALIGLAVTGVLLPAIALAIKLAGGPGPVLYSQQRVGLGGREFRIFKFRTMCQDAELHGATWAARDDARVTRVGCILRQTRLDELPQFWNVLRGEMSIVGPRPERPEFTSDLAERIPHYDRRHMVLPGVTGWAQVMFPYGASVEDALEKLQYDMFYIKNRSLWLDLMIMVKTVGVMAHKVGAR